MLDQDFSDTWSGAGDFVDSALPTALAASPEHPDLVMLNALAHPPMVRERLHAICALYAHAHNDSNRRLLLDRLEETTLQLAHHMAHDLLEAGWRPSPENMRSPVRI